MKTFIFNEKNGSGTATVSAENNDEACNWLEETMTRPRDWRIESNEGEEE